MYTLCSETGKSRIESITHRIWIHYRIEQKNWGGDVRAWAGSGSPDTGVGMRRGDAGWMSDGDHVVDTKLTYDVEGVACPLWLMSPGRSSRHISYGDKLSAKPARRQFSFHSAVDGERRKVQPLH